MGLLQNGFRNTVGVFRIYGAGTLNGAYPYALPANYALTGSRRNMTAGEGIKDGRVGLPMGYLAGGSYQLPQKPGLMSARAYDNTITATATGLMGIPIVGSVLLSVTPGFLEGQLISWGLGNGSVSLQTGTTKLEANVKGVGTATVTFVATASILPLDDSPPERTGNSQLGLACEAVAYPLNDSSPIRNGAALIGVITNALLGAVLDAEGTATVSVEGAATPRPLNVDIPSYTATGNVRIVIQDASILPMNDDAPARNANSVLTVMGTASALPMDDDPPARTAFAMVSFSGVLTPYALGHMVGAALPYTELSPQALADAVWSCQAEAFTVLGTMGKKINDGGAGGLTTEQEQWLQQAAEESSSARKASVNKAIITTTAEGGQRITIYEDDGVTPLFSFDLSLDGDTRTPV